MTSNYSFTLMTAHLKSRRPVPEADEAELREQEALLLREKIDQRFKANPGVNLIVLGDFNDTRDSRSTRALIGRGRAALLDRLALLRRAAGRPGARFAATLSLRS